LDTKGKPLFLIVDDEPEMCWVLEQVLRKSGFACLRALSGQEALSLIAAHDFRMIFLDAKLPDVEGLELAKNILHNHPGIDIVMVSGYFYRDDVTIERAMSSGLIRAFISKPFDHEEILGIIRTRLAGASSPS